MAQPGLVGTMGEYNSASESIMAYLERLELYLDANNIAAGKESLCVIDGDRGKDMSPIYTALLIQISIQIRFG